MATEAVLATEILTTMEDVIVNNFLSGMTLRLFQNDYTPTQAMTLTDFTECTFPGYAAKTSLGWSAAALIAGDYAQSDSAQQTFTRNASGSPQNIFGWYLEHTSGLVYLAARDVSAPIIVSQDGDQYRVNLFDVLDQGTFPG